MLDVLGGEHFIDLLVRFIVDHLKIENSNNNSSSNSNTSSRNDSRCAARENEETQRKNK